MNKTKICFISTYAYPLFNPQCKATFGGSEVQLYLISKEISKRKQYQVSFVVGDFNQKKVETHNKINIVKGILNRNTKSRLLFLTSSIYCQFKFLKTLKEINADIYIQRSAGIDTGIIAMYCKIFNKKFIHMISSDIACDGELMKSRKIIGLIYKIGLSMASSVISQSKQQQELLKKTFNINSLIIKNVYEIPPEKQKNEKNGLLWVGRLNKLKQAEIFISLAQNFPKHKFTIVAPESDDHQYAILIQSMAKKYNNIEFIQSLPFSKIDKYFSKSKIFINTSKYEGFPNTFIQSMIYKAPIVSLNVNPDNFLSNYKCGFCAHGNLKKFKQNIHLLLTDQALWLKMSTNAYRYVYKNHNIKQNIKKYINIINI